MREEIVFLLVSSFLFLTTKMNLIDVFFVVLIDRIVFKLVSNVGLDNFLKIVP